MKSADLRALSFASADDSEEIARAELYGLLARLWIGAPDEALLTQFRVAVTEAPQPGGFLETPWQALVAAMRATSPRPRPKSTTPCSAASASPRCFSMVRTTCRAS